jgi:hypothetical protein
MSTTWDNEKLDIDRQAWEIAVKAFQEQDRRLPDISTIAERAQKIKISLLRERGL